MVASVQSESRSNDALPVCLGAWPENPYSLVSWWEMEQFKGVVLHDAIDILDAISCRWRNAPPLGDAMAARLLGQQRVLTLEEHNELETSLRGVESNIRACGLPTSAENVMELRIALSQGEDVRLMRGEDVVSHIDEIHRTLRREMRTVLFLSVTARNAEWYNSPLKDWETVVERWPKVTCDITESSKCFALDRFAGSIFHILLVAEFGVIQVGNLLGVSGDKPGWGCVQRLEQILDKPYKSRAPLEQEHSALLENIVPMIIAIKDSSRHKIMHVDNKLAWLDADFSPQIASEVISSTRGFMRRLAKDLPVVPPGKP